jgi:hypothetical protein
MLTPIQSNQEQSRIRKEYEDKLNQLERERQSMEEDKGVLYIPHDSSFLICAWHCLFLELSSGMT